MNMRFATMLAIAPTGSNSLIKGMVSPSIEPYAANVYTQSKDIGNFTFRNPFLLEIIEERSSSEEEEKEIWDQITRDQGSVKNIDILNPFEKDVFRTTGELNMHAIVDLASDRQQFIDQGQSINLWFRDDASKEYIHSVYTEMWQRGCKSAYYQKPLSSKAKAAFDEKNTECTWCQ